MGTKQRRERERQATRQGILDGARQIAREEGWPGLTIRKVADYIEYSPSIVYEYFDSKEAILLELMREGFRRLSAAMRQAQEAQATPDERVLAVARAYWQFALDNRDLYEVMHGMAGVVVSAPERVAAVQEVCAVAMGALESWAASAGLTLDDPLGRTEIVWGLLHGMVSLALIDRIGGDAQHARQLADAALRDLLAAWRAAG